MADPAAQRKAREGGRKAASAPARRTLPRPAPAGPPGAHGVLRVAVVDDHPIFRRGLVEALQDAPGIEVCAEAGSISAALAAIAAERPDVAIVDLALGDENGLDLVASLAAAIPPVPVLVVSGRDERLHADRALKAGALGYIMKDKAAAELLAAVRRVATGEPYVSAATAERIFRNLSGPKAGREISPLVRLSDREWQVLNLVGRGMATHAIAARLQLSIKTIEAHYAHIKTKLGLRSGRELVRAAVAWCENDRL